MSEPRSVATRVLPVVPGVSRWFLDDDRIGGSESDAYAVVDDGRAVLIDPLPLVDSELEKLGEVRSIILTASCHQRSAWRYRRRFKVPVFAPEGAAGLEEAPDMEYSGGESLPNGLISFHAPGPTDAMYALWLTRVGGVVFLSDLVAHDGSGLPTFLSSEYQDEPERTRMSVRRIFERLPVEVLCFAHGPPIVQGGLQALKNALANDREFPQPAFY